MSLFWFERICQMWWGMAPPCGTFIYVWCLDCLCQKMMSWPYFLKFETLLFPLPLPPQTSRIEPTASSPLPSSIFGSNNYPVFVFSWHWCWYLARNIYNIFSIYYGSLLKYFVELLLFWDVDRYTNKKNRFWSQNSLCNPGQISCLFTVHLSETITASVWWASPAGRVFQAHWAAVSSAGTDRAGGTLWEPAGCFKCFMVFDLRITILASSLVAAIFISKIRESSIKIID